MSDREGQVSLLRLARECRERKRRKTCYWGHCWIFDALLGTVKASKHGLEEELQKIEKELHELKRVTRLAVERNLDWQAEMRRVKVF